MPIALIVAVVVLLIGVAGVVLSRENWKWQNITLVSMFLVLALLFYYLGAKELKIQQSWRNEIAAYQKKIAEVDKDIKTLREGEFNAAEHKWITPSVEERKRLLQTAMYGRGRVWDQVTVSGFAPDTGVLVANVVQPTPPGIVEKKTILYVFDKARSAAEGGQFLGEFEVTKVDGQNVTLSPVLRLRASDLQRITQQVRRGSALVMYEIMPTDSLQLYAEKDPAERVALFGNSVPAEVKQEFAKDGGPPAENEADPSRVWRRVKALKSFDVAVKVDGKEEQQTVNEGTELVLDPQSAQQRIDAGDVAPVEGNDKVYRRSLRDYALLYRDYNLRIDALVRRIEETAGQLAVVTEANAKVTADLAIRDKEKASLVSDKARFVAEQERITNHVKALNAELDAVRAKLKQTYDDNVQKEEELVRLTYEIADRMRNRVVAAP